MKFCRNNLLIEIYCDLNLIADRRKQYTLKHIHIVHTHSHTHTTGLLTKLNCKTDRKKEKK